SRRKNRIVHWMYRFSLVVCLVSTIVLAGEASVVVGPTNDGAIVSTQQLIRPAGKSVEYKGRPVDLVLTPDHKTLYVKSNRQVLAIDAGSWTIRQEVALPAGASMHGIVVTADGRHVYVTTAGLNLIDIAVSEDGTM